MVQALLILFSLALVFAGFVYFLTGLDKITGKKIHPKRSGVDREDPRKVFNQPWEAPTPRPRICPLCGTYLNQDDYLYAALGKEPPPGSVRKRQAQIFGCRYCFTGAKDKLTATNL